MTADNNKAQILLKLLCSKITNLTDGPLATVYQNSLVTLSSNISASSSTDEFAISDKIKRKLARTQNEREAVNFADLHRKLETFKFLQERWSILLFLFKLSESKKKKNFSLITYPEEGKKIISSTPFPSNSSVPPSRLFHSSSTQPSSIFTNNSDEIPLKFLEQTNIKPLTLSQTKEKKIKKNLKEEKNGVLIPFRSHGNRHSLSYSLPITEEDIIRDLIFVFQAIDGKSIKYFPAKDAFILNMELDVPQPIRTQINRLSECGFLYKKINFFLSKKQFDKSYGLVGQSFCSALKEQLNDYFKLIAILQAKENISNKNKDNLTLRKLEVCLLDFKLKLFLLSSLADLCLDKKGGEIASIVYFFTQHGDPSVKKLSDQILNFVAKPIFQSICDWIYNGELEDKHQEFLISKEEEVKNERMWYEKFSIRKSMIPVFINKDQVNKILLTGKTIYFLRNICQDKTCLILKPEVQKTIIDKVPAIFNQNENNDFSRMIEIVYKQTSSYLLDVLYNKYQLINHFKALRKYILLGQGDFIRHLMDLLEEDLAKPAQTLFLHNLTGILETAIRSTNAQYENPEIIKRLDVMLLEISPRDSGWDVFSLQYHTSGHIKTVLTNDSMINYLKIFNFMWRAKRMEYVLAGIWKNNMTNNKLFRAYKEFKPLMLTCNLIGSEMMHLVQQIQYYINFEVLECSWVELMEKVSNSHDLDQVIQGHQEFLNSIISRSLLDSMSAPVLTQLRTLFDMILQFKNLQSTISKMVAGEVEKRREFQENNKNKDKKKEEEEEKRKNEFLESFVPLHMSKLRILGQSYKKMVEQFLSLVSTFSDVSLRFLIFRLNFNEFYFHHQLPTGRMSKIFILSSSSSVNHLKMKK